MTSPEPGPDPSSSSLHDVADRGELRSRYYGLLQELRVVLPGVQVLMAFLLTVPFAARFGSLDDHGRAAYAVALVLSVLASICFISPTAFHRAAGRTRRSARLVWAVRMTIAGLALLAGSLVAATYCVTRFVFGSGASALISTIVAVAIVMSWVAIPVVVRRRPRLEDPTAP